MFPYLAVSGQLTIIGRSPDGDSIRFIPDDVAALQRLRFAQRLRLSPVDGSVQLRLDSIDAPETHYAGKSQPFGLKARDKLLAIVGYTDVTYATSGSVDSSLPVQIPATIVAQLVEVNGRPVSYLFVGHRDGLRTGQPVTLTPELLAVSINGQMIMSGLAYITLYSSTPPSQRDFFIATARAAKSKGVWTVDKSTSFTLVDQDSIGPQGQLILPKLFRRCSDYLHAKSTGFSGTIVDWLKIATSGGKSEDDSLWVGSHRTTLSQVIKQTGDTIMFEPDLLDVVFIEKS